MTVSCIVPFRSTDPHREDLFEFTMARIMSYFPDWDLIVGDCEGEFSRSAARNCGAAAADGDTLVFCDADTIWNPEYLEEAIELAQESWALPYTMYYNLSPTDTMAYLACDELDELVRPIDYEHALDYVISGTVVVTREAFDAVGGYDERFIGWGYEDDAFATALTSTAGPVQRVEDGFVCHLWHPVPNGDSFAHPAINHNRTLWKTYKQAARQGTMSTFLGDRV